MTQHIPPFDLRELRNAFGAFMTGVTVVTSRDDEGHPLGFTANSFTSVSLDPPLLLVCVSNTSRNYSSLTRGDGFAVNILSAEQKNLSNIFARPVTDRFSGVRWQPGPYGAPVLDGVSAWFDCAMYKTMDAGDHTILLGRVEGFELSDAPGLGYARGAYVTPVISAESYGNASNLIVSALIAREGNVLLVPDETGKLSLPQGSADKEGVSRTIAHLIAKSGVSAHPGFVYSVFDDEARDLQNISFLCQSTSGNPARGEFVELTPDTLGRVADQAIRTMLTRFADESRLGNFGMYFGNQNKGDIRTMPASAMQARREIT